MRAVCASLALVGLLWSSSSAAFCRATTCNPADPAARCPIDGPTRCITSGVPLRWTSGCITINVQRDGAPRAGISPGDAQASVQRAVDAWLNADCGAGTPSISIEIGQPVACDASEYSSDRHNANIVMFREQSWPYEGGEDALGITRLRFDDEQAPGELWDADIELNAVAEPLAVGNPKSGQVDLDSLITHEMGHLLGLSHTVVAEATMTAGYQKGSIELRSLAADDVAGICSVYPPGRTPRGTSCEPRHGFSELCAAEQPPDEPPAPHGCALSAPASSPAALGLVAVLTAALVARRRRR